MVPRSQGEAGCASCVYRIQSYAIIIITTYSNVRLFICQKIAGKTYRLVGCGLRTKKVLFASVSVYTLAVYVDLDALKEKLATDPSAKKQFSDMAHSGQEANKCFFFFRE